MRRSKTMSALHKGERYSKKMKVLFFYRNKSYHKVDDSNIKKFKTKKMLFPGDYPLFSCSPTTLAQIPESILAGPLYCLQLLQFASMPAKSMEEGISPTLSKNWTLNP